MEHWYAYQIKRSPRTEDEIHSAFDVAILEEMEAPVVAERVLEP